MNYESVVGTGLLTPLSAGRGAGGRGLLSDLSSGFHSLDWRGARGKVRVGVGERSLNYEYQMRKGGPTVYYLVCFPNFGLISKMGLLREIIRLFSTF